MTRTEPTVGSVRRCFEWQRAYEPSLVLGPHAHPEPRLCVVLGGSFHENGDDGWRRHQPGTLLYRPSGYAHEERFGARGAACAVFELGPELVACVSEGFDSAKPHSTTSALHIAGGLRREIRLKDAFSAAACQSLLWQAIVLMGRSSGQPRQAASLAREAAEVIQSRFRERTSLSSVARSLSVAPSTLSRAFGQTFGLSIGEFVQRCRCDEAAALLAGAMPIVEIALECGFSSQAHLTATFRRYKGTTPARFRRGAGDPIM